jgi:hypothetical protein
MWATLYVFATITSDGCTVRLEITHNYVQHYTPMTWSILSTVSLEITHNYVHRHTPMMWYILSTVRLEITHNYVHDMIYNVI